MKWVDKKEYKKEILEVLGRVNEILDELEWVSDVAPLADEDKWGRKNWVARMVKTKGMLKNIRENLEELK